MHLSTTESLNFAQLAPELKATARALARKANRRFAQLVLSDGRIAAVVEVAL